MRRAAFAYRTDEADAELAALADAAGQAAERAGAAIDEAVDFVAASTRRIALMEAEAAERRARRAA